MVDKLDELMSAGWCGVMGVVAVDVGGGCFDCASLGTALEVFRAGRSVDFTGIRDIFVHAQNKHLLSECLPFSLLLVLLILLMSS